MKLGLALIRLLRKPLPDFEQMQAELDGFERLAQERKVEGLTVAAAIVRAYRHPGGDIDLSPLAEKIERVAAYITEEINGKTINPTPSQPGSGDQRPLAHSIHPGAYRGQHGQDASKAHSLGGIQQSPPGYGGGNSAASSHPGRGGVSQSPEKGGA